MAQSSQGKRLAAVRAKPSKHSIFQLTDCAAESEKLFLIHWKITYKYQGTPCPIFLLQNPQRSPRSRPRFPTARANAAAMALAAPEAPWPPSKPGKSQGTLDFPSLGGRPRSAPGSAAPQPAIGATPPDITRRCTRARFCVGHYSGFCFF